MNGFEERSRYLLSTAEESLADVFLPPKSGFERKIRREPHGTVFIIAAWNYPYLVSVNGVLPALLAGNCVLLKQAPQTFPCADRFADALKEAGLPDGVFSAITIDHDVCKTILSNPKVHHVHFTGSVQGGRNVEKNVDGRFISLVLHNP